jgi:IS1 family transposase
MQCGACKHTFSARYGTSYFDVQIDESIFTIGMRALAEGNSLRATGRIVDVDKDTICHWLDAASKHCRAVTLYHFHDLHMTECQLDELWSFVRKKEKRLSPIERLLTHYGDVWVWLAFVPPCRLVPAFVVGKRNQEQADLLVRRVQAASCGYIPFFTSDQLPNYPEALLNVYGVPELIIEIPGKRGRKPIPRLLPPQELDYAVVVKHRHKGQVIKVDTAVVFGDEQRIAKRLSESPVSRNINTSFVERQNLSVRQGSRRLTRKVNGFSKEIEWLEKHLWLSLSYYHFVLPNAGLREPLSEPIPTRGSGSPKRWRQVTPAMATGLTDHVWSIEELLTYRVPPQFLEQLDPEVCGH